MRIPEAMSAYDKLNILTQADPEMFLEQLCRHLHCRKRITLAAPRPAKLPDRVQYPPCGAVNDSPAFPAKRSGIKDPVSMLFNMMEDPYIYMHGPEHHIMVGAALITAYYNAGGEVCLEEAFRAA